MKQTQIVIWIVVILTSLCGCTSTHKDDHMNKSLSKQPTLANVWGIEIQRISLSAEGYMLDFRYEIVDSSLAKQVTTRQAECYVIDQKSGTRMIVPAPPKVGSLRNKSPEPVEGKIYYVMFANPGRRVQQGDKVTVVINEMQIPDLVVQ